MPLAYVSDLLIIEFILKILFTVLYIFAMLWPSTEHHKKLVRQHKTITCTTTGILNQLSALGGALEGYVQVFKKADVEVV